MVMNANRNLPTEIESNILSRLPVKTLIRFILVCKSWLSLISGSYFINMHRIQNQKDNLLLIQYAKHDGSHIVVADSCSNERSIFTEPRPHHRRPFRYHLVDSCNGLVCIYCQNLFDIGDMGYIILWNPAVRIIKTIRNSGRMRKIRDCVKYCVGFGFQNKTNDYKVIRFVHDLITHTLAEVEIYSLGSDSWKKIEGAAVDSLRNKCLNISQFGVYVANVYGAYCWIAKNGYENSRIISFDMGDEAFKDFTLPPSLRNVYFGDSSLFKFKDSLGVLGVFDFSDFCDGYVWVMKEYGEPKSWTMLYKFVHNPVSIFMGTTLETELVLISCYGSGILVHVLDVDKLQINTKDINILKEASQVSHFTESLVLLDDFLVTKAMDI